MTTFEEWADSVVGYRYRSMGRVYLCTSYDPTCGFWMRSVDESDTPRETNVSERAIGRTFHQVRMTSGAWRLLRKFEELGRMPTEVELPGVLMEKCIKTLEDNGLLAHGALTPRGEHVVKTTWVSLLQAEADLLEPER